MRVGIPHCVTWEWILCFLSVLADSIFFISILTWRTWLFCLSWCLKTWLQSHGKMWNTWYELYQISLVSLDAPRFCLGGSSTKLWIQIFSVYWGGGICSGKHIQSHLISKWPKFESLGTWILGVWTWNRERCDMGRGGTVSIVAGWLEGSITEIYCEQFFKECVLH